MLHLFFSIDFCPPVRKDSHNRKYSLSADFAWWTLEIVIVYHIFPLLFIFLFVRNKYSWVIVTVQVFGSISEIKHMVIFLYGGPWFSQQFFLSTYIGFVEHILNIYGEL